MGGSTTIYPAMLAVGKAFEKRHPGSVIKHSESSSGHGISQVIDGKLTIARASRGLTEHEVARGAIANKNLRQVHIGFDVVCIVVHPSKLETISSISIDQLKQIFFDGTVTEWSQLDDRLKGPINVFVRDRAGSGTATFFNQLVVGSSKVPYVAHAKELRITTDIVPAVSMDANAISYAPIGFLDEGVRTLDLDIDQSSPVACDETAVKKRKYPLTRDMFLITDALPKIHVAELIDFVLDKEGQDIISNHGIIPLR